MLTSKDSLSLFIFGVRGGFAKYYGVKDAAPLPTTVDHVISALAG